MDEKSIYMISREIPSIQLQESLDTTIFTEHFLRFDILLEKPIYIKYDDTGINHDLSLSIDNDLGDIINSLQILYFSQSLSLLRIRSII